MGARHIHCNDNIKNTLSFYVTTIVVEEEIDDDIYVTLRNALSTYETIFKSKKYDTSSCINLMEFEKIIEICALTNVLFPFKFTRTVIDRIDYLNSSIETDFFDIEHPYLDMIFAMNCYVQQKCQSFNDDSLNLSTPKTIPIVERNILLHLWLEKKKIYEQYVYDRKLAIISTYANEFLNKRPNKIL